MVWCLILAAASIAEARAVRRHRGTASEAIARLAHVETMHGKVAFLTALAAGSALFGWHIVTFQYSNGVR